MSGRAYELIETEGAPIKAWTRGVPVEESAEKQLRNVAKMPFIYKWIAVMPDVHWGIGATVGSVIPSRGAVMPAAVGVDIGCGMLCKRTSLDAARLTSDQLKAIRSAIESVVPHGRTNNGGKGDRGAWGHVPERVQKVWDDELVTDYESLLQRHPALGRGNDVNHLGTMGTGNHFLEVCRDTDGFIRLLLHSGSRGVGNRIGTYFIKRAKEHMEKWFIALPDKDLAYLPQGTQDFEDYKFGVTWAQRFAWWNRLLMMDAAEGALRPVTGNFEITDEVHCHHNYLAFEHHMGENIIVTRKGAVRARTGDRGIIPGSMGARTYIVRGKGNPESFHSCSHGAGRAMSRHEAKRRFTIADHEAATAGVECRKDADVIDETPMAYKPIEAVIAAQADLIEVETEMKQLVCVKG
jgi:tRNA-splicing ligase RtcB